jgi:predicted ATPase/DNA-binding SARP family transcriptional activator
MRATAAGTGVTGADEAAGPLAAPTSAPADPPAVRVRLDLLGPLRLTVAGTPVDVPGERRRAVLALLAIAAGHPVSTDQLLDAVWPDAVPDSGRRALHSHVSRLRGHLGPAADRLVRDGAGYRLDLAPGELDVAEARALAHEPTEPDLARATGLWRGPALEEFPDVAPLAAEAVTLAELRRQIRDDWLDARLAALPTHETSAAGNSGEPAQIPSPPAGGPDALVPDATRAAAEDPTRERTHALLVRALAAAGRQADALRAAHDFRRRLAEETGLDPSPAFGALEQEIARGVLSPAPAAGAHRPLARPAVPMVGREHELATLRRLAAAERLATVIGPGGVGKTRLALEVAAEAATGSRSGRGSGAGSGTGANAGGPVTVVELATVEDPRRTVDALAAALGVGARAGDQLLGAARDALCTGTPLVVLDNCEHVLDAVRDLVATLLAGCPGLTLVATSREPLGLPGEHVLRLGPLPVPEEGAHDVLAVPAVAAFLAHARRRTDVELGPGDAVLLADVVRRLDGLPLALELAAGRMGTLSLADLHARLDRALDLLSGGRPTSAARHRTLRATIDWSYRALGDDERRLLGAVGAFPGGVTLGTAERLGDRLGLAADPAAVVARLVDTSMLAVSRPTASPAAMAALTGADGDPPVPNGVERRYRALETVRSFVRDARAGEGSEGSEGGESGDDAEHELVAWAVDLAAEIDDQNRGPAEPEADARLRAELPNLRAAWDAADRRGDVDALVSLALGLEQIKTYRELSDLVSWALDLVADERVRGHARWAEVVGAAGVSAWLRGDLARAEDLGTACLAAASTPAASYRGVDVLATIALFRGDPAGACRGWRTVMDVAPGRAVGHYVGPAALAAGYAGDVELARSLLDRAFAHRDVAAVSSTAFARYAAAELDAGLDPDGAANGYAEAIRLARTCGATFVEGVASVGLVRLWAAGGRTEQALAGYRELLVGWRRSGHWTQLWTTLRNLAGPLADAGRPAAAALLLAAADQAPEAALVAADDVAAELAGLGVRLRDSLGDAELARIWDRATAASRSTVVDEAIAAVDAALGTPGRTG